MSIPPWQTAAVCGRSRTVRRQSCGRLTSGTCSPSGHLGCERHRLARPGKGFKAPRTAWRGIAPLWDVVMGGSRRLEYLVGSRKRMRRYLGTITGLPRARHRARQPRTGAARRFEFGWCRESRPLPRLLSLYSFTSRTRTPAQPWSTSSSAKIDLPAAEVDWKAAMRQQAISARRC